MILLFASHCFAQHPNFPFLPESLDSTKQWALTNSEKWENFLNKKENMYGVRWNELTGSPHSIIGPGVLLDAHITSNNIEQLTKSFELRVRP